MLVGGVVWPPVTGDFALSMARGRLTDWLFDLLVVLSVWVLILAVLT